MPADSDPKSSPVSGASSSIQIEPADGRAAVAPTPRPLLSEIAARLAQAVRGLRKDSAMRQSLEEVIEESERETQDLSSQERMMLGNLLTFGGLTVSDVMVPRADIVSVEEQTSFADLVALFREAQHSRLPIYRETLDDPLGMVHIKDVIALVETGADGQLRWPPTSITSTGVECSRPVFRPGTVRTWRYDAPSPSVVRARNHQLISRVPRCRR